VTVRNSIASQAVSQSGHVARAPEPSRDGIIVGSFDLDAGGVFPPHVHREHQLAWASSGVLTVTTAEATWVLPPTRAVWLPAGVRHTTGASTPATVRSLYFPTTACPISLASPTAIAVDDLLAALIPHLARVDLLDAARARAEAVVFDLITPTHVGVIRVPMPRDGRASRVAKALISDPADDRDLAFWGRYVGASTRTLARLFAAETGLSFGRWRAQVRMRAALVHLAAGMPVNAVARRAGYRTASAFVAAFRQTLGATPGNYFARHPPQSRQSGRVTR
jgi:AraC-like DNA-binding protein/quercetin dioxygenase-like cupin family protein